MATMFGHRLAVSNGLAVFDCGSSPKLNAIQDPARLGWKPIVKVEHYLVGANEIIKAAE